MSDRTQRAVLAVVAALVALVGAVVVIVDDGEDGDDIDTAATTSTTRRSTSTSSSSSTSSASTSSTVVATPVASTSTTSAPTERVRLGEGDGWTATRTTTDGRHCVELTSSVAPTVTGCDVEAAGAVVGDVVSVAVPGGLLIVATTTLEPGAGLGVWSRAGGVQGTGSVYPAVADGALGTVALGVVGDATEVHLVASDGGGHVVGATGPLPTGRHVPASELGLRTGHPFAPLAGWEPLAGGDEGGYRSIDAGRYRHADGAHCVLVRELVPEPRALLDRCDVEPPELLGETVLLPTDVPGLYDAVAIAAPEVASWRCELPDGTACDYGGVALRFGGDQPANLLLHTGPIGVAGRDPDHLVLVLLDAQGVELGRAQVPTP